MLNERIKWAYQEFTEYRLGKLVQESSDTETFVVYVYEGEGVSPFYYEGTISDIETSMLFEIVHSLSR